MSFRDSITEAAQRAHDQAAEANANKTRDLLIDIQSKAFDKAAAYTNVIMFGGYAGAFAIWSFTKELLGPEAEAWVALLLTVSLTTFIFFEVFKMIYTGRVAFRQRAVLVRGLPPQEFFAELKKLEKAEGSFVLKVFIPVWYSILVVAVGTALGAVGLLLWKFGVEVWRGLFV